MNLQNLRWPVLVTTLGVTLAVLFGSAYLFQARAVDAPLNASLASAETVISYTVEKQTGGREVVVLLKETPDLRTTYTQVHGQVGRSLKGAPFRLRIEDRRSPEMAEAGRRFDLHLHEALVTGRFAELADRVEAEAAQKGMQARVGVDTERVYLQLHKDGNYLYTILERKGGEVRRPAEGGALL